MQRQFIVCCFSGERCIYIYISLETGAYVACVSQSTLESSCNTSTSSIDVQSDNVYDMGENSAVFQSELLASDLAGTDGRKYSYFMFLVKALQCSTCWPIGL